MATQYRQFIPRAVTPTGAPGLSRPGGAVVAVTGFDGVVIASITRFTESTRDAGRPADQQVVISIEGDIDNDTAPVLRESLLRAIETDSTVCCDLTGVAFFGAAGVNTVLEAHGRAASTGVAFSLRGVHGLTDRILAITGIAEYVVIAG